MAVSMPVDELIFDRTKEDVDYALNLQKKWFAGTISDSEKVEWMNFLKGNLNYTDLNRIEKWIAYVADQMHAYGCWPTVKYKKTQETTINKSYTGAEQILEIPSDGTYTLTAAGAIGGKGNTYSGDYSSIPGKGAQIQAAFDLKAGDKLHLIIGGAGSGCIATAKDGASGGGGGGTFVFKEIDTITDSRYQFTKNSQNYEVLLVAAGGGGAWDESYKGSRGDGYDGDAESFYSPDNYSAWSTTTNAGTSSSSISSCLGINQYISYDLVGAFYTRNSSKGVGGYGGGSATDDNRAYGGGWKSSSYITYSFSSGTETVGINGANSGNGTFSLHGIFGGSWSMNDIPRRSEIDRIRKNVDSLRVAIGEIPEWRNIIMDNTLDFERVNALEWDIWYSLIWLKRMVKFLYRSGDLYLGEV